MIPDIEANHERQSIENLESFTDNESSSVATLNLKPSGERFSEKVLRYPKSCTVLWIFIYMLVAFLMIAFGGGWPLTLGSLEDLERSTTPASTDWAFITALTNQISQSKYLPGTIPSSATNSRRLKRTLATSNPINFQLQVFYSAPDGYNGTVFDFIERIRDFERWIVPTSYCPVPSNFEINTYRSYGIVPGNCARMYPSRDTPVNYFYPTTLLNTRTGVVSQRIYDGQANSTQPVLSTNEVLKFWLSNQVSRFVPADFVSGKIALTRSTFYLSFPDQLTLTEYVHSTLYVYLQSNSARLQAADGLQISWNGGDLISYELNQDIAHDAELAAISAIIVAIIVWLLMDFDLFLTTVALICLALAIPLSYACFTAIFGYREIFCLSFMSLYILFGVGSDACFVFLDEMHLDTESPWIGWKRALKATFVTMSTTAISFFVNASSSIIVIRQWGLFMGLVISWSWIAVVTIFPWALLIRRHSFKRRSKVTAWFGGDFARFVNRFRLLLICALLAFSILSITLMFSFNKFQLDMSLPTFFDPNTSNLGRVLSLKDEFDWVSDSSQSSGVTMSTAVDIQCEPPYYVLNPSKTGCDSVCPTKCAKFSFSFRLRALGQICPCYFPQGYITAQVSSLTGWPQDRIALTQPCATCNPDASFTVEFYSIDGDFQVLKNQLSQIQLNDNYYGLIFTWVSMITNSPSSSAAPSTRQPTATKNNPSVGPTDSPSSRPGTHSPSLKTKIPSTFVPSKLPSSSTMAPTPPVRSPSKPITSSPVRATLSPTHAIREYESHTPTVAATLEPSFAPSSAPSSVPSTNPSSSPSTSPSASPSTSPSTSPSLKPSSSPTFSQPTNAPSKQPTSSPTNLDCQTLCSNHGTCDKNKLTCTCDLGYSGATCNTTISTLLNDAFVERITVAFGIKTGESLLDGSFDPADLPFQQTLLLSTCAIFCHLFNETKNPTSRCSSAPFLKFNYSSLDDIFPPQRISTFDLNSLGYRRLQDCVIGDFVNFARERNISFPISNFASFNQTMSDYLAKNPTTKLGQDSTGRLRFFSFTVLSSFSSQGTSPFEANLFYQSWVSFFKQYGLSQNSIVFASNLFGMSQTEVSAVSGFAFSWSFTIISALMAILVYTCSLTMALLSGVMVTFMIFVVSFTCFFMANWTFGVFQAMGLSIITGLVIDYTAHICYAFVSTGTENSGLERIQETFHRVGYAIISSMLTTVGACSILFATIILPFQQFGLLVTISVVVSTTFAFFLLAPLLAVFGDLGLAYRRRKNAKIDQ